MFSVLLFPPDRVHDREKKKIDKGK